MPSCPSWKSACAFHVFCCFPWWGAGIQRQKAVWCSRHTSVKTRQGVLLTGFQSGVLFHIDLFPEDCPFIGHETSFFPSSTLALAQRGAVGLSASAYSAPEGRRVRRRLGGGFSIRSHPACSCTLPGSGRHFWAAAVTAGLTDLTARKLGSNYRVVK